MNRESRLILLACACGCLIGGIIAQVIGNSIHYQHFWVVGAFIGGLVAWVLADPAQFRAGAKRAWQESVQDFWRTYDSIAQWRPNRRYWTLRLHQIKQAGLMVFAFTLSYGSLITSFGLSMWTYALYQGAAVSIEDAVKMWMVMMAICAIFGLLFGCMTLMAGFRRRRRIQNREFIKFLREAALFGNPVGVLVLVVKGVRWATPKAKIATRVVRAAMWAGMRSAVFFLGYAIAYIHNERRTICMVDTTIVVAVCYLSFGSVWAVAMSVAVGPIVGLINYWLVAPKLHRLQLAS